MRKSIMKKIKKGKVPPAIITTNLSRLVSRNVFSRTTRTTRTTVNPKLAEIHSARVQEIPNTPGSAEIVNMAEIDMDTARTPRLPPFNLVSPDETISEAAEIDLGEQPLGEYAKGPSGRPNFGSANSDAQLLSDEKALEEGSSRPNSGSANSDAQLLSNEKALEEGSSRPNSGSANSDTQLLSNEKALEEGSSRPNSGSANSDAQLLSNEKVLEEGSNRPNSGSANSDAQLLSNEKVLEEGSSRPNSGSANSDSQLLSNEKALEEGSSRPNSGIANSDTQLLSNERVLEEGRARSRRVPLTCNEMTITVVCLIFGVIAWSITDPLIHKSLPIFASLAPFSASQDKIPWAEQASIIASTSCAPLYARFSDVYGRKRLFSIAMALLIVGQALCMVTASFPMIIAAKIISGAGGGGVYPLAFVILADIERLEKRARHTAPWAVVFTTSSLLIPQAGQALIMMDANLWRWLFLIPIIFGILGLLFAFLLPRSRVHPGEKRDGHRIDWRGSLLILLGIACLLAAISWSSQVKVASDAVMQAESQASQALSSSALGAVASVSSMVKSAQSAASDAVASITSLVSSTQSQTLPAPTSFPTISAQLKARREKRDDTAASVTQFNVYPAGSTVFVTVVLTLTTTDAVSTGAISTAAISTVATSTAAISTAATSTVVVKASSTLYTTETLITTVVIGVPAESHTVSGTALGSSNALYAASNPSSAFNLSSFTKGSSYALLANPACQPPVLVMNSTNSNGSVSGTSRGLWTGILVALFVVSAVFISAFVFEQYGQGEHEATIPLRIFENKILNTIFAVEVLFGATFSGLQNFLPVYYNNLSCDTGSVSSINLLYPFLSSILAATIFVLILTRFRLYRPMSLLGAVLMLIGTVTLRVTMALPEIDTHVLDGVSLCIACISVIIIFQILSLWAQSKCECKKDKELRAVVTGLTQCFFMIGQALGYTISTSIFSNHLVDALAQFGIPTDIAQQFANLRSIPSWAATPDVLKAYVDAQILVYHGFLIPCMALAVVLLLGTWIWAKKDSKDDEDATQNDYYDDEDTAQKDPNDDASTEQKGFKDDENTAWN